MRRALEVVLVNRRKLRLLALTRLHARLEVGEHGLKRGDGPTHLVLELRELRLEIGDRCIGGLRVDAGSRAALHVVMLVRAVPAMGAKRSPILVRIRGR